MLHRYACVNCRSKKIKCDNLLAGCNNCQKQQTVCVYKARRPRKAWKTSQIPAARVILPAAQGSPSLDSPNTGDDSVVALQSSEETKHAHDSGSEAEWDQIIPSEAQDFHYHSERTPAQPVRDRLFVADDARSRYITDCKAKQIANLEFILSTDSADRPTHTSSSASYASVESPKQSAACSLLGLRREPMNLPSSRPSPSLAQVLWEYYVHNVDILIKILYKPAIEAVMAQTACGSRLLKPTTETLLSAIWFAAASTMTDEECQTSHGKPKAVVLVQYRSALEDALCQLGWATTQDVEVLQALVLLLVFSPDKSTRVTWTICGIALGIAQAMGMHRAAATYSLNSVMIETRRRIWWTLCLLDNRISEACGLEVHVPLTMDTPLPAHVNDADLESGAAEVPLPRNEFTEMTMTLIKFEMARIALRVKMARNAGCPYSDGKLESMARETVCQIETKYALHLDHSIHLHHLCYLGSRLIIAKLWNLAYSESSDAQCEMVKAKTLTYNAEVLEIARQLPDKSSQHGWFFRCKVIEWYAMAYLLLELCKQTHGPHVDRAWAAIDAVISESEMPTARRSGSATKNEIRWQKLLNRARSVRRCASPQDNRCLHAQPDQSLIPLDSDCFVIYDEFLTHEYLHAEANKDFFLTSSCFEWDPTTSDDVDWGQLSMPTKDLQ